MEVSDMLDVVHYYLDEDTRYTTAEEMTLHSNFRTRIFSNLYDMEYRYAISENNSSNSSTGFDDIKPYIPPTDIDLDSDDPFGGVLDAPIR